MAHRLLDAETLREAFRRLDALAPGAAHLVIGGGAAMVAVYDYPLATRDVDATTARGGLRLAELEPAARVVARELDLEPDWLNPYFETYTGVLPADYGERLRTFHVGGKLRVDALGPEDLLVMKCFAGRDKDLGHARALVRLAPDLDLIGAHLSHLMAKGYPKAQRAADFFDDLRDEVEG